MERIQFEQVWHWTKDEHWKTCVVQCDQAYYSPNHSTRKVHTTINEFKLEMMHTALGCEIWCTSNGRESTNVTKSHQIVKQL